jgi:hypothetical protein
VASCSSCLQEPAVAGTERAVGVNYLYRQWLKQYGDVVGSGRRAAEQQEAQEEAAKHQAVTNFNTKLRTAILSGQDVSFWKATRRRSSSPAPSPEQTLGTTSDSRAADTSIQGSVPVHPQHEPGVSQQVGEAEQQHVTGSKQPEEHSSNHTRVTTPAGGPQTDKHLEPTTSSLNKDKDSPTIKVWYGPSAQPPHMPHVPHVTCASQAAVDALCLLHSHPCCLWYAAPARQQPVSTLKTRYSSTAAAAAAAAEARLGPEQQ